MSRIARLLVQAAPMLALLVQGGCDRTLHEMRRTVYAPTEAGLTLIYENPALPDPGQRFNERLQVRVSAAKETPEGQMVRLVSSTLQGQQESLCLVHKGGWTLVLDEKRRVPLLPEGFPDQVSRWDRMGSHVRILGRAAADLPGLKLPADFDRTGVWVESESPVGLIRIFYLAGIGEAETRVLRNGRWVCTNRLVSTGFTDLPKPRPTS